jgi:hypothetical protein
LLASLLLRTPRPMLSPDMPWGAGLDESLDSTSFAALACGDYWPVHPSTFALTLDEHATLLADPTAMQLYQDAMIAAGTRPRWPQPTRRLRLPHPYSRDAAPSDSQRWYALAAQV